MITEEKKRLFKILIALILIICVIILAQFAWAKYMTSLNGNSKAEIAKWSLKVNRETNDSFTINLSETREKKQEAEVQDGFIGPGTSGKFIIEVDATETEVSLEYNINMAVDYNNNTVFPKNLIFYSDPEMQNAIYHTENGITLNGFIAQSDKNKTIYHTMYWKWDFETGQTQKDKDENNIEDSYWMGKDITLSINVVGQQVNQNPTTNQYAVTFDANGGILQGYGNSEIATKLVNGNEKYGNLPTPSRAGYEFVGWSRNLADEISDNNYSTYNYHYETSSEIRDDGEFGGLINQKYFRINGSSSTENVDTMWYIYSKKFFKVSDGEKYIFSFFIRSQYAIINQYLDNTTETEGTAGHYYIEWDNGTRTYMSKIATFYDDGDWHLITNTIIVPEGVKKGKIFIGTDRPNLYGPGSYVDIANIQFAKDSKVEPYYIEENTTFDSMSNTTLYAKWSPVVSE